jgi:beta-1,4-mannosyltransferase
LNVARELLFPVAARTAFPGRSEELPLRVGSWPGYGYTSNRFVPNFLDALAGANCRIVSVDDIDRLRQPEIAGSLDVLILHWPEMAFWKAATTGRAIAQALRVLALLAALPTRTRVVWIVHNLEPHDAGRKIRALWRVYTRLLSLRVSGVLTLSPGTLPLVQQAFPGLRGKPAAHVWHPAYGDVLLPRAEIRQQRLARGFEDHHRVIGYCGMIRPYKGLEQLVTAFRSNPRADIRLLVAGVAGHAMQQDLRQRAGEDARIRFEFGKLSDDAFATALACCDVVAAPFRKYLHSGSIIHALAAGRAVLTPRTAYAQSLQDHLGPSWIRLYDGDPGPDLFSDDRLITAASGLPDLADFQADRVGPAVAAFLRHLSRPV